MLCKSASHCRCGRSLLDPSHEPAMDTPILLTSNVIVALPFMLKRYHAMRKTKNLCRQLPNSNEDRTYLEGMALLH